MNDIESGIGSDRQSCYAYWRGDVAYSAVQQRLRSM